MRKRIKTILSFILILAVCITSLGFDLSVVNAEDDVSINVFNSPRMDIVLTQTDKSVNMTTFKEDIKTKLNQLGIDTSNTDLINISTIETTESSFDTNAADATTIFNTWNKYGSGWLLYAPYITNSAGQGLGIIDPNTNEAQDTNISAGINVHSCGSASGFIVKYDKSGTAYMATIVDSGYLRISKVPNYSSLAGSSRVVDSSSYTLIQTPISGFARGYSSGSAAGYAFSDLTASYDYKTGILTTSACNKTISYNIGEKITGGTGLYAGHCVAFQNVAIATKVETVKEYSDVLSEPKWRDDAYRFIINVDNTTNMFTDNNTRTAVLSKTMNDDIHFIGWGTSTTKPYVDQFIKDNDNKGKFTYSNNYNQAVTDTAQYIYNCINKNSTSDLVLVGEQVDIAVTPADLKNNTANIDYPDGKWKIIHNADYYENSEGIFSNSGKNISNLVCSFDKPGKYDIQFVNKLVKTVYAHRKPVASFSMQLNNGAVTLNSDSYDLDAYSQGKNGIKTEKWSYMKAGDSTWTNGKLTSYDGSSVYIVKLEVEDYQGATSYTTRYIGQGKPVAYFNFKSSKIKITDTLEILDTSYDPEGGSITGYTWILKKGGTVVGTYTTKLPTINFNQSGFGKGEYTYTLKVINNRGTVSDEFTRPFTVIDAPIINSVNITQNIGNSVLTISASDNNNGLSKIVSYHLVKPDGTEDISDTNAFTVTKSGKYKVYATNDMGMKSNVIEKDVTVIYILTINPNGGSVGGKTEEYSVTGTAETSITLPIPTHDIYMFCGWELEGGGTINENTYTFGETDGKLTVKWNSLPEYVEIYKGKYYEGQTVSYENLLEIVRAVDLDDLVNMNSTDTALRDIYNKVLAKEELTEAEIEKVKDATNNVEVEIVKIEYQNGDIETNLNKDTYNLNTSSKHIGKFNITYKAKDILDKNFVTGSDVINEIEYTKECQIVYNNYPSISLEPCVFIYSDDVKNDITKTKKYIKSFISVSDNEDDKDDEYMWKKEDSKKSLQNSVTFKVSNITLKYDSDIYTSSNLQTVANIKTLEELYALKNSNKKLFDAIDTYDLIVDAKDQFGKYASGKIIPNANTLTINKNNTLDKTQNENDRTITVFCDSTNVGKDKKLKTEIRFVSTRYINTVMAESYWGDAAYGKTNLVNLLNKKEQSENLSYKEYSGNVNQSNGNKVNIHVKDYTD